MTKQNPSRTLPVELIPGQQVTLQQVGTCATCCESLRDESQRRIEKLRENESRICTERSVLDQALEALARQRRDQFAREQLLQTRLESCSKLEAALIERETVLCSEAERLRRHESDLAQSYEHAEERLAQFEWQLLEREAELDEREAECVRLEREMACLQGDLVGWDAQQNDDRERHQIDLYELFEVLHVH